jgi:uncharacterized coiled-coil protein SlyX
MMEDSLIPAGASIVKRVAPYIVAVVLGGAGVSYAVHEHHGARTLATQNEQMTAQLAATQSQLDATHSQLDALTTKINALAASNEARVAPVSPSTSSATKPSAARHRASAAQDARFKKLQSQVDAQGKAIEDARNDLTSTRTELTGSIARTHDELVVLEKKGERNYYEFDVQKSKEFKRTGPLGISLRKANEKHQFADLQLMVEDRTLTQKHVNLYQPAMFFQPDSQQPIQIVINNITKNHIHGYVSAPKYRPSELAVASDANANPAKNSNAQPPSRQKLSLSESDLNQQ